MASSMEIFMADFYLPFFPEAFISRHFQALRITHFQVIISALFRKIHTAGFPDEYRLQLPLPRKNAQNASKIQYSRIPILEIKYNVSIESL